MNISINLANLSYETCLEYITYGGIVCLLSSSLIRVSVTLQNVTSFEIKLNREISTKGYFLFLLFFSFKIVIFSYFFEIIGKGRKSEKEETEVKLNKQNVPLLIPRTISFQTMTRNFPTIFNFCYCVPASSISISTRTISFAFYYSSVLFFLPLFQATTEKSK